MPISSVACHTSDVCHTLAVPVRPRKHYMLQQITCVSDCFEVKTPFMSISVRENMSKCKTGHQQYRKDPGTIFNIVENCEIYLPVTSAYIIHFNIPQHIYIKTNIFFMKPIWVLVIWLILHFLAKQIFYLE